MWSRDRFILLGFLGIVGSAHADVGVLQKLFEFQAPTLEQLAQKLGYANAELAKKEAQIFAERIEAGYLPDAWGSRCSQGEYSPSLCSVAKDYFADRMEAATGSRRRRVRVRYDEKKIGRLQGEDYQVLLGQVPKFSEKKMKKWVELALAHAGCPRNLSLALADEAEEKFNEENYRIWGLQLMEHGVACLKPEDEHGEYIFLHLGLFQYALGKKAEAFGYLKKALQQKIQKEEARVLYWTWKIASETEQKEEAQVYLEKLRKKYPSSWSTILALSESGQDPFSFFQGNPDYPDTDISGHDGFDRSFSWLQLMLKTGASPSKLVRYGEYIQGSLPLKGPPGVIQFFARTMEDAGLYRLQILSLTSLLQERPEVFHSGLLKLLYPRPYLSDFLEHSTGEVDLAVLYALSRQESSFERTAISNANAQGLFQVLPSTARSVKKNAQLLNHVHNIEVGMKYFARLVRSFEGSIEKSLAAYNAGAGRVRQWEKRYAFVPFTPTSPQLFADLIPYRETREYITAILRNAYWYHRLYPEFGAALRTETYTSGLLVQALKSSSSKSSSSQ